jgi:hypothetical protein
MDTLHSCRCVSSAYGADRVLVQVSEQYPVGICASCEESSDIQRKTSINCRDERRVVDGVDT